MKYSVEVETDSLVYDTPCSSPAVARQLNWAIEVDNIYCIYMCSLRMCRYSLLDHRGG